LPQDQVFRFQHCFRLEARSQDIENQLEQIGHQDASLRRPPAASTPNRIFGTHSPLFSKTSARADSQKRRSSVPFRIASRARKRENCGRGRQCWRFITRTRLLMRNRVDIDPKHSRAIVQQIGERLAAFMKEEPELPASLRAQIDRLRELEEQSPSIIPSAER
jgi:hypothetical protein